MLEGRQYRELFKKVEKHLSQIEQQKLLKDTLGLIIDNLITDFKDDFGFTGARLYVLDELELNFLWITGQLPL